MYISQLHIYTHVYKLYANHSLSACPVLLVTVSILIRLFLRSSPIGIDAI